MTVSTWKRGTDEAEVFRRSPDGYVAWNKTRAWYAVEPAAGVEYTSAEEAEKALEADGWVRM